MAEMLLTSSVAKSLVTSHAWQAYVTYLLDEFTKVEARYDRSCASLDQGLKMGLRAAIEYPYKVAEQDSPLMRQATKILKRRRPKSKPDTEPADDSRVQLTVPLRSSGLV